MASFCSSSVGAKPRCTPSARMPARLSPGRHSNSQRVVRAAAGKLISKTEVPAFIPRDDFMGQLHRWAGIEVEGGSVANFGMQMDLSIIQLEDEFPWGFTAHIKRNGDLVTSVCVEFDDESTEKHQYVGRRDDGFPVMEGDSTEVAGKNLIIRKLDDNDVDDETRSAIRAFCELLGKAVTRYYSFGSVFSEEI